MSATIEMPTTPEDCRVVPTEEAIAYLEQQGISLHEARGVTIPSKYAQGYKLATGKVVVIENGWRDASPALIFSTVAAFEACCRTDYFPLPPAYLTWPEVHAQAVQRFLTHPAVYAVPLRNVLDLEAPFPTLAACEAAFERVRTYIRKKSLPWEKREPIAFAFGLAAAQFCVVHWGLSCTFRKTYELYNPYYRPLLELAPTGRSTSRDVHDVFSTVLHLCKPTFKADFQTFMWWLTGISPVKQAEGIQDGSLSFNPKF
jgi:hypothetical protein